MNIFYGFKSRKHKLKHLLVFLSRVNWPRKMNSLITKFRLKRKTSNYNFEKEFLIWISLHIRLKMFLYFKTKNYWEWPPHPTIAWIIKRIATFEWFSEVAQTEQVFMIINKCLFWKHFNWHRKKSIMLRKFIWMCNATCISKDDEMNQ